MSSKTIDERIVSMKFDNADFERNVQTSINSIDKLKQGLDMNEQAKSLNNLNASVKNVSFDGLAQGIESVRVKFSAMEVVAVTALANIANSAINAGKNIVSALTIAPVSQGYSEYELKMGSVQTIMASTGESLETVMGYLEELNLYADRTIYSFSDMTSNIGKFTNAGVKLNDAVAAIQGVANVAAVSGANTNEASRAMYNFAQALSAGYVKLIDWKSIENANMATVEFKQQLIDTALALGTVVEEDGKYISTTTDATGKVSDAFTATSMFNDSLSAQWMTTEVLTTTLGKYSDTTTDIGKKAAKAATEVKTFSQLFDTLAEAAGSGWATTWELIVGDYNEALEFLTTLSDMFGGFIDQMSTARNTLLKDALSSPWDEIVDKIEDAGVELDTFQSKLIETANQNGIALEDIIEQEGSLEKAFKSLGNTGIYLVVETLKDMAASEEKATISTSDLTSKLDAFKDVVNNIRNADYESTEEQLQALNDAGYDYVEVQELIEKCNEETGISLKDLNEAQLKSLGYTEDEIGILNKLSEAQIDTVESTSELSEKLEKFQDVVDRVWNGDFGEGEARFEALAEAGYDYAEVQELVNKCVDGYRLTLDDLNVEQLENIGYTSEEISKLQELSNEASRTGTSFNDLLHDMQKPTGRELLIDSLITSLNNIGKILSIVKEAWNETIPALTADGLYTAIEKFNKFTHALTLNEEASRNLKDTFKGLFSVVNGGLKVFEIVVKLLKSALSGVDGLVQSLLRVSGTLGFTITEMKASEAVANAFTTAIEKLSKILEIFSNYLGWVIYDGFEAFEEAGEGIPGVVAAITNAVDGFNKVITDSLEVLGLNVPDKIKNIAKTVNDAIHGILGGIPSVVSESISGLNSIWDVLKIIGNLLKSAITGIGELLLKGVEMVGGLHTIAGIVIGTGIYKTIKNIISPVKAISEAAKQVSAPLKGVNELLQSISNRIDPGKSKSKFEKFALNCKVLATSMLEIAAAMLLMTIAFRGLAELDWEEIAKGLVGFGSILGEVGTIIVVITKFGTRAKGTKSPLGLLIALAASMLVLSKAFIDISELSWEEIGKGLVGFGALLTEIGAFIVVINKFGSRAKGAKSSVGLLVALAVSMLALSKAFIDISELSWEEIGKGLVGFGALLTEIGAFIVVINKFGSRAKGAKSSVGLLVALAVSMLALSKAFIDIANLDSDSITRGLIGFGALLAEVGAIIIVLNKYGSLAKGAKSSSGLLIALAASMIALTEAFEKVAKLTWEEMIRGLIGFGGLLTEVGVVIIALNKWGTRAKGVKSSAGMLIALAASIAVMAKAFIDISELNWEEIAKGLVGLAGMLTEVGATIIILNKYGSRAKGAKSSAGMLATLALAMLALSKSFKEIAQLSWDEIKHGIVGFGAALTEVGAAIVILNKVGGRTKGTKSVSTQLLAISVSMLLIGKSFTGIAELDWESIKRGLVGFGALLIEVEALIFTLSKLSGSLKSIAKSVVVLGAITLVVSAALVIIDILQSIAPDGVNETVAALSLLMVSLSLMVASIGKIGNITIADIGKFAVIELLVAALGGIIVGLCALDSDLSYAMAIATAMSELILALSATMILLEVAGLGGSAVFVGEAALLALIAAFAAIVTALGGLDILFDGKLQKILDTGIPMLIQIAEGIGEFFGAIIKGFISEVVSVLPEIGDALSGFAESAKSFFDEMNLLGNNSNAAKGVLVVAEALAVMGAASFISAVNAVIGIVGLASLKVQLSMFADAVKSFVDKVSELDEGSVNKAKLSADILGTLVTVIPKTGGLMQTIFGSQDLEKFGNQLKAYGEALVKYADEVSKLDDAKINAVRLSAEAGKELATLANSIPVQGGWASKIMGAQDLGAFGNQIKAYGECLIKYGTVLTTGFSDGDTSYGGLTSDMISAMSQSAAAGTALSELANTLPNVGGLMSKFTGGQQGLDEFGNTLEAFGKGIVAYAQALNADGVVFDEGLINSSVTAAKALSELEAGLPKLNEGTIGAWFGGEQQTLATFGTNLKTFGTAMHVYYAKIKDLDMSIVEKSAAAVKVLADIEGGLKKDGFNVQTLSDFGSSLEKFGGNVKAYWESIQNVDASRLEQAVVQLRHLANIAKGLSGYDLTSFGDFGYSLTELGKAGIEGFTSAFENATEETNAAATAFINNFVTAINDSMSSVTSAFTDMANNSKQAIVDRESDYEREGATLVTRMVSGIQSVISDVPSKFTAICNNAVTNIRNHYSDFYQSGKYMVEGFADGISDETWRAEAQARATARAALNAANAALDEHSPSRETYKTGRYFVLGMANAIRDYSEVAENASADTANNMLGSLMEALSASPDYLNDNLSLSPVITPVLDLDNLQNGINTANSMTSGLYGLDLSGAAAYAQPMLAGIYTPTNPLNTIQDTVSRMASNNTGNTNNTTMNNTFNIESSDPQAVADEVSRVLQHQVDRRSAAWA